MKKEDLEKTYEELNAEIEHNNKQIDINNERKKIAKANMIEGKALLTFLGSFFPYMGLMVLSAILGAIGVAPLSGTILAEVFPMIIFGGALCMGTIIRKIIEKKHKVKEKLKEFTNATTQLEILEEAIKYEIELDKSINKNNSIKQAKNLLKSEQANLEALSDKYDINGKNTSQTKEEAQNKIDIFSNILQKQYNELDILTTKQVLNKEFYISTQKKESKLARFAITFSCMAIYYLPSLLIVQRLSIYPSYPSSLIPTVAPFIAIIGCSIGYVVKKDKDDKKVFNNLSKTLKGDSFEEQQDISNKIKEISATIIQLQEQKRALESFSNADNEKGGNLEQSITNELTGNLFNLTNEDTLNTTVKDEKGPSLVLRKKNYKSNDNK